MSNRLVSLLTVLLITAGLLVSCVPVPMEDLAAQQTPAAASDYRADSGSDRVGDRVGDRFTEGCIDRDCARSNQRGTRPADGHEQAQ